MFGMLWVKRFWFIMQILVRLLFSTNIPHNPTCCQSETAPELNFSPKYLPMEELLLQWELNIDLLSARWNRSECLLTLSGLKVETFSPQAHRHFYFFFLLLLHKHTFILQKMRCGNTHRGEYEQGARSRQRPLVVGLKGVGCIQNIYCLQLKKLVE